MLPVVQKCVKEQTAALDKIEQQIIEKKFLNVAKDKMAHIGTLKTMTKQFLGQENWDRALSELETARTAIADISAVCSIFEYYYIFILCL